MIPLRQLDANALVSLDLLLQERSVTAAARRQGVSQSAMSQTLRRLRTLFDDALLVRRGTQMLPTPRAEALRDPLHRALGELERVIAEEPQFSPASSRRELHVAVGDYAAALIVPRLLERVGREAPGIDLRLRPSTGNVLDALREGSCDLLIGVLPADPPAIDSQRLWTESFVLVVRKGHALCRARKRVEAFAAARHLLVSPGGTPGGRVDEILAARGLSRRVFATIPFFLAAPAIVARTDAVLTVPRKIAELFAAHHDLVVLEHPLDVGTFDARVAWSRRHAGDPAIVWLRALVTADLSSRA